MTASKNDWCAPKKTVILFVYADQTTLAKRTVYWWGRIVRLVYVCVYVCVPLYRACSVCTDDCGQANLRSWLNGGAHSRCAAPTGGCATAGKGAIERNSATHSSDWAVAAPTGWTQGRFLWGTQGQAGKEIDIRACLTYRSSLHTERVAEQFVALFRCTTTLLSALVTTASQPPPPWCWWCAHPAS